MNALPALEEVRLDGWLLRFANGHTGRANSVYPLDDGNRQTAEKIDECERLYAQRSLPCIFKMTSACCPGDLDEVLAGRGYSAFNRSLVQCADLRASGLPAAFDADGMVATDHPTDRWFDAFVSLRDLPARHAATFRQMLGRLALPARYLLIAEGGITVSCGLAVAEGEHVGLFDIVTHPNHRRRGLARQLVAALLQWGRHTGATTAYLQVMADNEPALALYRKFGFKDRYAYWYRRQPQ